MHNRKMFWILLLALVLLIGGASVLYGRLGSQVETGRLAVAESEAELAADHSAAADSGSGEQSVGDEAQEAPAPAAAPDFTVYDGEGNAVSLSDFAGKPVVVNFWASWCGPCKIEMPDFDDAYAAYGEEIHFLMVNMTDGSSETAETASAYIEENGYTFPVYYDTDYSAAVAYGVSAIPTTYFIDAAGNGVAYGQGALDRETLERGIAMLLPVE